MHYSLHKDVLLFRQNHCSCTELVQSKRKVILQKDIYDHTVNSLWPSDAIWQHESKSTLAQVKACCLPAPSHYLNQWWLAISEVQWQSPKGNFTRAASAINHWWGSVAFTSGLFHSKCPATILYEFEHNTFNATSPRGQWGNSKI